MSSEYKPLVLLKPKVADRKKEKPRPVPLPPEIVARRKQIAKSLLQKISPVSKALSQMSDGERKAIFLKLEHDGKIDLTGTGLKAISESNDNITLAIPKTANLEKLEEKIEKFASSMPDRNGMLPHGMLVSNLTSILQGTPRDRLCEDFQKRYKDLTKKNFLIYEIELMTLKVGSKQQKEELAKLRLEVDGVLRSDSYGAIFEHTESKGSSRVVVRSSGATFKKLVEDSQWYRKIVYFDSRPKFQTFSEVFDGFKESNLGKISPPEINAPVVCVIDSGISAGNPLLKPVSKEEMFRSFLKRAPTDVSDEHGHGSGVGSLVSYYALDISDGASNSGKVWLASARVLDATNFSEEDKDGDEGRLFSEVLKEVVNTFVPLGVKIFNLSVNDENRRWSALNKKVVPRNSWVARTIDFLSRKHDVLFVISTGNISKNRVRHFIDNGLNYPAYLMDEESRLLDPAQSALGITVGSIAHSVTLIGPNSAGDSAIANVDFPSPFSRRGPGINGEVKPELVERGGNYVVVSGGGVTTNAGTNVIMASNDSARILSNRSGTSFAAPRVAHSAAMIYQELANGGVTASAPLIKALLVNSALHPRNEILSQFLGDLTPDKKEDWLNIYGHGIPDRRRAIESDKHSALLYFQGNLKSDKVAFLSVPVPKELAYTERGLKRITVTVVYAPEVQRWGLERYLGTVLKWRMFRGDIDQDAVIEAMSSEDEDDASYRKSLEQEILFDPKINLRSRGSVQHASFEWTEHREAYSQNHYTLALGSYERWGRAKGDNFPYAVVVRIEYLSHTCSVHALVSSMISVSV